MTHPWTRRLSPAECERLLAHLKDRFTYNDGLFYYRKPSGPKRVGDVAGSIDHHGYRLVGIKYRVYRNSYLVWLWHTGCWPTLTIDHEDRDCLNDRFHNLRDVTSKVQANNRSTSLDVRLGKKP